MNSIILTGEPVDLEDAIAIARGMPDNRVFPQVKMSPQAIQNVREARAGLDDCDARGDIIYGFNTGCGIRKNTRIPHEQIEAYQRHYIPAHCVGFGEPFPSDVVRLAMALRVNSFLRGNSGVRLELCEALLAMLNAGVVPYVPENGSVGASGDLCPLAHMSAALMGIPGQEAWYQGKRMSAVEALRSAGLEPFTLAGKEAMALTNGATFILAEGMLCAYDASDLIEHSHVAAAMSLEAIRGELAAFDERIHEARGQSGQKEVAWWIQALTDGSERMTEACRERQLPAEKKHLGPDEKPIRRVQDAYSFRCYPQVVGKALEIIDRVTEALLIESGASTDNPLLFRNPDGNGFVALSGGNFHGESLALDLEQLKLAVQSIAGVSERRFFCMLDPHLSYGLPADLAGNSELNTGLMIAQYAAAALVSRNKILAHPAVVDSIPTSAGQEDYVSMGSITARHLREMVDNATAVVAWELIAAAQALSLTQGLLDHPRLGKGTEIVLQVIREVIPVLEDDRYLHADHQQMLRVMASREILDSLSVVIG